MQEGGDVGGGDGSAQAFDEGGIFLEVGVEGTLDDEDIFVSDRSVCQQLERERRSRPASHTDRDRRLSILELAQRRRARFHAQAVAYAFDQLRVRRPAKDNGAAHRGRAK